MCWLNRWNIAGNEQEIKMPFSGSQRISISAFTFICFPDLSFWWTWKLNFCVKMSHVNITLVSRVSLVCVVRQTYWNIVKHLRRLLVVKCRAETGWFYFWGWVHMVWKRVFLGKISLKEELLRDELTQGWNILGTSYSREWNSFQNRKKFY